jgi:hypothetical protein
MLSVEGMTELSIWAWVWYGLAALATLAWFAQGLRVVRRARMFPSLEDEVFAVTEPLPRLSVVIPACNEVDTLEPALASVRAQAYPDLEILLVDDRSDDGTSALVDKLAAQDPRIKALHVTELPEGWLGKVHAMHQASQVASGDWLLFTDADVHFGPGALERGVGLAEARGYDHLAVMPDLSSESFMVNVAVAVFWINMFGLTDAAKVLDPEQEDAVGVGAFNLVRRAALERSEGLEWLRMELADDFGLGLLLKRAGGRNAVLFSRDSVRVAWYPSVAALVRGISKNAFAHLCHFSLLRAVAQVTGLLTVLLLPAAALLAGLAWGWLAPLLVYLLVIVVGAYVQARVDASWWPLLLWPVGVLVLLWTVPLSAWSTLSQGGVVWRGTLYPLAELRANQRIRL